MVDHSFDVVPARQKKSQKEFSFPTIWMKLFLYQKC